MPNKADQANGGNRSATGDALDYPCRATRSLWPTRQPRPCTIPQPQEMDWGKKQRRRVTDDAQRKAATVALSFHTRQ